VLDQDKIRLSASVSIQLLDKYAGEEAEVRALKRQLRDLLGRARDGLITTAIAWDDIPSDGRMFLEGPLDKYPDLEEAYSQFCVLIADKEAFVAEVMKGIPPDSQA